MVHRIVPFVDHEIGYRVLRKLFEYRDSGLIEVPAVVTTEDNARGWWPSVKQVCISEKIPLLIYNEDFDDFALIEDSDWYLLISWKHVLGLEFVSRPRLGTINLHYSLLPDFRGVYPVNWAIIKGEKKTGITYHFVNERIDGGEIFLQVEAPIHLSDNARSLQLRLDDTVIDSLDDFLKKILSFREYGFRPTIINLAEVGNGYFSRQDFEEVCCLDLQRSYTGLDFLNLLRGLSFFSESDNAYVVDEESGKKIHIYVKARS